MQENWLRTKIIDGVAETSNGKTKPISLPTSNFIGNIRLRCGATVNNAGNDADFAHLWLDQIDKIKVVGNGFATIVDLKPKQLRAMMTPVYGSIPGYNFTQVEAETSWVDLPICFGRFPYDKQYILPAKLFKTLNLEVEYSMETTDPAWDTGTFTIWAECDEYISNDDPASKRIIRRTEVESGTTSAGNIDVDLPLGNVYKRIWCQSDDNNVAEGTSITDVQLRINNGSEIPLTSGWDILHASNDQDFGLAPATLSGTVSKADDDTVITDLGTLKTFMVDVVDSEPSANQLATTEADAIAGGTATLKAQITVALTEATDASRTIGADSTARLKRFNAESLFGIPEFTCIILDKGGDMSKCPDSAQFNDAKIRMTGADTNATYSVCLEEVVQAL